WDPAVSVRSFCKKAVAAGVERLTLLQARTDEEAGGKSLTGSEDIVRASGLRWTILRPTWFTQNFDEGVLLDSIMAGH
ncbi:SDR family NAD(P)-dependent oxidoreductase, partial [Saccharothrix sp. MB29]|nr:SDR family NAD(P)-dependent oxidoreductase [Saccharothrix sp. MB29]